MVGLSSDAPSHPGMLEPIFVVPEDQRHDVSSLEVSDWRISVSELSVQQDGLSEDFIEDPSLGWVDLGGLHDGVVDRLFGRGENWHIISHVLSHGAPYHCQNVDLELVVVHQMVGGFHADLILLVY